MNLIERAIRLLNDEDIDHRSAFVALLKVQKAPFSVMPILLQRRATYRFSKDVHPAIEALDGASRDLGYVDDQYLYCDAGSTLWKQLADELSGDDKVPPQPMTLEALKALVIRAAEKVNDAETIAAWSRIN